MTITEALQTMKLDFLVVTPGLMAEFMEYVPDLNTEGVVRIIFWIVSILLAVIRSIHAWRNLKQQKNLDQ